LLYDFFQSLVVEVEPALYFFVVFFDELLKIVFEYIDGLAYRLAIAQFAV